MSQSLLLKLCFVDTYNLWSRIESYFDGSVLILFFISSTLTVLPSVQLIDQEQWILLQILRLLWVSYCFLRTVSTLSWLFNFTLMGLRCSCLFPPILLNSITLDFAQTASNNSEAAFVKSSFVSSVCPKPIKFDFLSSSSASNLITFFCFSGLTTDLSQCFYTMSQ